MYYVLKQYIALSSSAPFALCPTFSFRLLDIISVETSGGKDSIIRVSWTASCVCYSWDFSAGLSRALCICYASRCYSSSFSIAVCSARLREAPTLSSILNALTLSCSIVRSCALLMSSAYYCNSSFLFCVVRNFFSFGYSIFLYFFPRPSAPLSYEINYNQCVLLEHCLALLVFVIHLWKHSVQIFQRR